MAKLYFRYGTVSSAKTMNLLAVAHNYRKQKKKILVMKPKIDTRYGKDVVQSRSGLHTDADMLLDDQTELDIQNYSGYHCILVDEAQFLSAQTIEKLRSISIEQNIPIICYGLRTDFKTRLFEGSRRLMEIADSVEEIKTTCGFCNRKAVFNLKSIDGVYVQTGPQIQLGKDETYTPSCAGCYRHRLEEAQLGISKEKPKEMPLAEAP